MRACDSPAGVGSADPDGRTWRRRERAALLVLSLGNVALSMRAFRPGVLADNDFVCHYGYLKILVDHFQPATGANFGWVPTHNLGVPFLLYNPPPLLYWTAASLTTIGLSPLLAVKLLLVLAFVSVPLLLFLLARIVVPRPRLAAICVAGIASLFSSELAGLEFFLKNGMANAAFAVPLMLAGLVAFAQSLREPLPRALRYVVLCGVAFGLVTLTHLQTAYMLGLSIGVMAICASPVRWAGRLCRTALAVALGASLVSFWLLPSLRFSSFEPIAFVWLRSPWRILGSLLTGDLFSSYPVGFFRRFVRASFVGAGVTYLGLFGAVRFLRRGGDALALVLIAALAFWLALGPACAWLLRGLPVYDKLLWYRFTTLALLCWQFVAGYGLAVAIDWFRRTDAVRPSIKWLAAGVATAWGIWAVVVLCGAAIQIRTEADYPNQRDDLAQVAAWLREHGDKTGRIYSEFPKSNVRDGISVNYARHLLPVLTGMDEVMGWIYENNLASQPLVAQGLLHDNPLPILDLQRRLNVKYLTTQTPNFTAAVSRDPRWKLVLSTPTIRLFEARDYTPTLVEPESSGLSIAAVSKTLMLGGGGRVAFALGAEPADGSRSVLVKLGYSPSWRATMAGAPALVEPSADGLTRIVVDPRVAGHVPVELVWDIRGVRLRGILGSLAAGGFALVLLLGSRLSAERLRPLVSYRGIVGPTAVGVGLLALVVSAHGRSVDGLVFGLRNGIESTRSAATIHVGEYDDDDNGQQNFLLTASWSDPFVRHTRPARTPRAEGGSAIVSLVPGSAGQITIHGAPLAGGGSFVLQLGPLEGPPTCRLSGRLGVPITVPSSCVPAPSVPRFGPGAQMKLVVDANRPLAIDRISVDSGITYVEGESFLNENGDSGDDAFYYVGLPRCPAHNGALLLVRAAYEDAAVRLHRRIRLPAPGRYQLWALMYSEGISVNNRADVAFRANGREVGRTRAFLNRAVTGPCPSPLIWHYIGDLAGDPDIDLEVAVTSTSPPPSFAALDLIALVPIAAK